MRARLAMVVLLTTGLLVPSLPVAGQTATGDGTVLAAGLRSLAARLGQASVADELAARVPLTSRDVRDLLGLPQLIDESLVASLDELDADPTEDEVLDAVDDAGTDTDATWSIEATQAGWTLDLGVEREIDLPVSYRKTQFLDETGEPLTLEELESLAAETDDDVISEDTVLALRGGGTHGSIATTLTLDLSVDLALDPATATLPAQLVAELPLVADVELAGANTSLALEGEVGVSAVTATGELAVSRAWEIQFADQDGLSGLTQAEWESASPDTLSTVSSVEAPGDAVALSLDLASDLTPAADDGAVTWSVGDPTAPGAPAEPTVELGDQLAPFREVTASELLAGFTRYAAAVGVAEARGDVRLPLTDTTLGDAFSTADVVRDAVQSQGAALVLCGRTDTTPPLGEALDGSGWYCQALTRGPAKADSVRWTVAGGRVTANGTADATVGTEPTANVALTDVTGLPDVTVTWVDEETGEELTAHRRFRTVQELAGALEDELAAATDVSSARVELGAYDVATNAFTIDVSLTAAPAAYTEGLVMPGSDLQQATGLRQLVPWREEDAGISVDLGTVELSSHLTVGLDPREADALEAPERFTLTTADDATLLTATGLADVTPDTTPVDVRGRIGFLDVLVGVDALTVSGPEDGPVLAVGLAGAEDASWPLDELLADPVASLVTDRALSATAELTVTGSNALDAALPDGDYEISYAWADVEPDTAPTITTTEAYDEIVRPVDVTPTVRGVVDSATDDGAGLTDASADFTTAFGIDVAAGEQLAVTLVDTATGASCNLVEVVSATSLRCAHVPVEGGEDQSEVGSLAGGTAQRDPVTGEVPLDAAGEPLTDNTFDPGDGYEVRGDATALGTLVTEGLIDLSLRLGALDALDESLPLIDVAPAELLPQLVRVREGLADLLPRIAEDYVDPASDPGTGLEAIDTLSMLGAAMSDVDLAAEFSIEYLATPMAATDVPHLVVQLADLEESGTLEGEASPRLRAQLDTGVEDEDPVGFSTDAATADDPADALPEAPWSSIVSLGIAVPLADDVDAARLLVLDGTGVEDLTVAVDEQALDLTAALGTLDVIAGADALLEGAHQARTGAHDADPLVDSTVTGPVTTAGTHTAADPSTTVLTDDDSDDFTVLGAGGTLSVAGTSCTVASVTEHTLTCDTALPDGAEIVEDAAYTYTLPSTLAFADTTLAVGDALVGDVVVRTDGGRCVVATIADDLVRCAADLTDGASFATDDAYTILDAHVLTDEDGMTDAIEAGQELVHAPTGASCTITAVDVGAGTITCDDALAGGSGPSGWAVDDVWSVAVSSRTELYAPGTGFDELNLRPGVDEVRKLDGQGRTLASCVVESTTADTLTCAAPGLVDGEGDDHSWAVDDTFQLGGVGELDLEHTWTLLPRTSGDALLDGGDEGDDYVEEVLSPALTGPGCTLGTADGTGCLRMALSHVTDDPDLEPFLGMAEVVVDGDGQVFSSVASRAAGRVEDGEVDLTLLSTVVPFLSEVVEDAVDGQKNVDPVDRGDTGWDDSSILLPLVGADLAAGADIAPVFDQIGAALLDLDAFDGDASTLGAQVDALLASVGGDVQLGNASVAVACPASPPGASDPYTCSDGGEDVAPDGVEVSLWVGQNLTDVATAPGRGCTAGCGSATGTVPFASGLPGLEFTSDAELDAQRAWRYRLVFGVDRATGPYLGVAGTDDLVVGARVSIPTAASSPTNSCTNAMDPAANLGSENAFGVDVQAGTAITDYSGERCFDATLGLLGATVYDGDGALPTDVEDWAFEADDTTTAGLKQQSRLDLETAVDLTGPAGADRISVVELVERADERTVDVDAWGNVDLNAVTDKALPGGNIPSLNVSIHWAYDHQAQDPLLGEIEYRDIVVDTRSFLDDFLGPWVGDALEGIGALRPVADFLLTPIPGLSDVAQIIGNPPISVFTLAQEASGQDLTLLYNLAEFLRFADSVGQGLSENINSEDTFVGLNGPAPNPDCDVADEGNACGLNTEGGYQYDQTAARKSGPCGSAVVKGKTTKVSKDCTKSKTTTSKGGRSKIGVDASLTGFNANSKTENIKQTQDCKGECTGKERARTMSRSIDGGITAPGLAFPFLSDSQSVYGMLHGVDAELVRLDLGELYLNVGIEFSWGPFMAGPVPIEIGIGGSVEARMRTLMGLDTLGMRTTGKLLDGFFLHDLDPNTGQDPAEISLTFSVSLSASLSIKVFSAGVRGTVEFIIGANLIDPDGDGRVRPSEIRAAGGDPLCVYQLSGDIRLILSVFAKLDFVIWEKEWVYDLFRRTWRLFETECEQPEPLLATEVTGENAAGLNATGGTSVLVAGDLVLNAGPLAAGRRGIDEGEADEAFIVRQGATTGTGTDQVTAVTVEAFGLAQAFTLASTGKVVALMGDGGDAVTLAEGTLDDGGAGTPVPFTLASRTELGAGVDTFEGGDGDDLVYGGPDRDSIEGGPGADELHGDGGDDSIDGGIGPDLLFGGADDDTIVGGQDGDGIDGGNGDDRISGGPGMAVNQAERIAELQLRAEGVDPDATSFDDLVDELSATLADGDDLIVGGPGADELSGHYGDDVVIGGSGTVDAASADTVRTGQGLPTLVGSLETAYCLPDGNVGDPDRPGRRDRRRGGRRLAGRRRRRRPDHRPAGGRPPLWRRGERPPAR